MMCVWKEGGRQTHTRTHTQQQLFWGEVGGSLLKQFTITKPTAHFNSDREKL